MGIPQKHNSEHVGMKEMFGVTALSTISSVSAIFMSTIFMQYMTDYAGLGRGERHLLQRYCW